MKKYQLSDQSRTLISPQGESITLFQIRALVHFGSVCAGQLGGWVEGPDNLSQQGSAWLEEQVEVFGGAQVSGDAQILGLTRLTGKLNVTDRARVKDCQVDGPALISGEAQLYDTRIIACLGFTADPDQILTVSGNAHIRRSLLAHQVCVCGHAYIDFGFLEHRACVSGYAIIQGNENCNVWLCDNTSVSDHARIVAGQDADAIPVLRGRARVADYAVVEGNCVLSGCVALLDYANLHGGPVVLCDHVTVRGHGRIAGNVRLENATELRDNACIETWDNETVLLRDSKILTGDQRITRASPFLPFEC
ncbi:hypothetical protein DT73_19425 [Mangrovibacter sp. MFB070]|uniref:hypothetical protein n=1 Tax=Mangrovibacter sp. MFB070 TaxID=1224318 RepID=UPI0004D5A8F7|nr:hypothetical protein [Mangrovibacter sp. MFB070]KEA50984.1 hypothetical protein DT73_19425 [Mangrovibacter sp. MFB070]